MSAICLWLRLKRGNIVCQKNEDATERNPGGSIMKKYWKMVPETLTNIDELFHHVKDNITHAL